MSINNCEIERKFLVRGEFKHLAFKSVRIAQGYISSVPERTVRIRIASDKGFITIKGGSDNSGMKRFEFEKEIESDEAQQLLELCEPGVISKTRYYIENNNHIIETDVFDGDNEGLILAEIELKSTNDEIYLPDWLGDEVTGDKRYYNSYLSKCPYREW